MKTFAMIAALMISAAVSAQAAAVRIDGGAVEGVVEDGLTVYRGIPFAAPPVGALRWREPQPLAPWSGVRKAEKFALSCMQPARMSAALGAIDLPVGEDCLYLNVWTPAKSAGERLPVLVWIYGGGFMAGSTATPVYSGEALARKGVVFVSVSYRVGAFGFLAHPELSAESIHRVSGNYGLLDQIAGLQWIKRNIAAFGGDPQRVTIFGESAGGIAVSMLAASPLAKGLFHGAISQSGGSFGPSRPAAEPGENLALLAEAERVGVDFAKKAGANSLSELRKVSAEALLKMGGVQPQGAPAWPTLDGWVIPDDQFKLYEARRYNDTPILIGTNSNEGALFGAPPDAEAYVASVHKRYGPHADRLLKLYPAGATTWRQSAMDLTRDAAFGWHNWAWARLQAQAGTSKVFCYYFDHQPTRSANSPLKAATGAVHAEEIIYVFHHLDQQPLPWTAADRAISDATATYWTNFAKQGDPNGPGVPVWPPYTDANPTMMHFNQAPKVGPIANLEKLKALDAYYAWRRTPEGAAWVRQVR